MAKQLVHLHWASTRAPFSRANIQLDLSKIRATPETVASIFGVRQPDALSLKAQNDANTLEPVAHCWPVQAGEHYQVHVARPEDTVPDVSIKGLYQLVGGEDRVRRLSLNFYRRVWYHEATPPEFRALFQLKGDSDPEKHARNQSAWFCEIWGGPEKLYTELFNENSLLTRMLSLHSRNRMVYENAVSWLGVMKAAVDEEFAADDPKIIESLSLYWLHFFAFFPYEEEQRAEFRRILFAKDRCSLI